MIPDPVLSGWSAEQLRHMAAALTELRCCWPATSQSLSEIGVPSDTGSLAVFAEWHASSVDFSAAAFALRLLAVERLRLEATNPILELVASGPDPTATLRDTGTVVDSLFREAESRILIVGYALHDGARIFARLAESMNNRPSLEATLCLDVARGPGNTSRPDLIVTNFGEAFVRNHWRGPRLPKLWYYPRSLEEGSDGKAALHAKCIAVDSRRALITSANLTPAAQDRNIELGVLISSLSLVRRVEAHFERMMADRTLHPVPLPPTSA